VKPPPFTYHRPETLDAALEILAAEDDARVIAGGQSLIPLLSLRLSQPEHLVDLSRIAGLAEIVEEGRALRIGAMVRYHQIEQSAVVADLAPLIHTAMPHIGHSAIRSKGTFGGSLAHADASGELPAVALALEVTLNAQSVDGKRQIPADEFYQSFLVTTLEPHEILVEVEVPATPPRTQCRVDEVARRHGDFAIAGLASMITTDESKIVTRAALSYFGVELTPVRITAAEEALIGRSIDEGVIDAAVEIVQSTLEPSDDNLASADYRLHVAGVLTAQVLRNGAPVISGAGIR
jgi:carbon-monoxide dehydrogenase medium subunit